MEHEARGRRVLGSAGIRGAAPQWYDVDVTAYVQSQKRAGKSIITVALQNTTHSSAQVEIASRETGTRGPALILTLAGPTN